MKKNSFLFFFLFCSNVYADVLPNKEITPGKLNNVSKEQICVSGYSSKVRRVTKVEKNKVFRLYHTAPTEDYFEVDHLISLELGGSNDIENLWPQSYTNKEWNAHDKDKLENRLHKLVCFGAIPLEQAQREISEDWISAYKKYIGNK